MTLTIAQILELAPDTSSRKAGQDQARPDRWERLGRAEALIWGEIKGSGASPYRTVCDLTGLASKCTCPSRKFPCKHGLGLMLIHAAAPLAEAEPPDWASAWARGRDARGSRAEKASETPKPVDEQAQAKRQQARAARVSDALDELDLWLRDLMRRGLAAAKGEPYAFWDRMAARLVDGQAPGLARRVRALPGLLATAAAGAPRPEAALALGLARLELLGRAARRPGVLSPGQAAQVRAAIGYPVGAEELATQPDRPDRWAVLAHTVEEEDRLIARSVWLVGRDGGEVAQVIDYGSAGSPPPPAPRPGQDFAGALRFHPGEPTLRAVFRDGRAELSPPAALPGATSVAAALDAFAGVLARAPWMERWPLRLVAVRLGRIGTGAPAAFGVGDATGCLPLRADPRLPALLTVAADRPVDLFGLYDGTGLTPLALVAAGHLYTLPAQDARPVLNRAA